MIATAVWKPPTLCGCELSMMAEWASAPLIESGRRVSYQHPRPFTVSSIEIVNVCAEHAHFTTDPLPADPYGGSPGYIRLPLDNPTPAQRLYIQLYAYSGQRFTPDTCDCRIYECHHRFDHSMTRHQHPIHTRRCRHHLTDDDDHTNARENATRKQRILQRAATQFGIDADTITWSFDEARVLTVNLPGVTNAQRDGAQAWADTNIGAGRVIVTNVG